MLNSHAFQFGSNNAVHTANFSINPNNLSGISCDPFQESKCLTRQHSIFLLLILQTRLPLILKLGFLTLGPHAISFIPSLCLPKSLVLFPLLSNCLNCERVTVTHIGTIQVTLTLILKNVLCVHSFTFNLISVSQLTKSLKCCLVFLSNFCFIEDLSCWNTIGVGKQHNNIYLL